MLKRMGQRLATAVRNYLVSNGLSAEVKNFSWEFNLVQNREANVFCMPGGKIVVYEGLLPYMQNEPSLELVQLPNGTRQDVFPLTWHYHHAQL